MTSLHVTKCRASLLVMDKQPSKRTLRRLRLRLARHLAKEEGQQQDLQPSSKRMCIQDSDQPSEEPDPSFDTGGDGAVRSDWELSGSEGEEPDRFSRCGDLNTDHSKLSDEELVSDSVELQSGSDDNFENQGSGVESDNLDSEDDYLDSYLSDEADFSDLESDQSSSEERNPTQLVSVDEPTPDHVPLYSGSHISYPDFNVAFLSLAQRHNLTYVSQTDILRLFSIVLPAPNTVPSSCHTLVNKFANLKSDTKIHHYCGCCTRLLNTGTLCDCCTKEPRSTFITISLYKQLAERFKGMCKYCMMDYIFNGTLYVYAYDLYYV